MVRFAVICLLLLAALMSARAQHGTNPPAFADAAAGAKKFQLLPGLKLNVWAAEPQLSNSVAFCFDGQGRVFLAESDRWAISVFDITAHTNWLVQDMSFRSVADRTAFLSNQFATNITFLTKESEVIRLLEDRAGGGRADHSAVFARGFNSVADGTAAGILATGTNVYFGNIPNLWRFPARPGGGPDTVQEPTPTNLLAHGFGVHIGVSGHDLHGLIKGPDGRIYMSFGDRGCVITNGQAINSPQTSINLPDTGGVLRCEPDGRNLEVFCYGLRNPQELAFDDYGNLWTVDNDTAGADPCRVLHLVEGGDYGWRTSYQHMDGFGPWVQEELWKGGQDGILPPAGTVSQGPSGLAFYPGTGFGDRLAGKFLHCDFPGGVWAFSVKPKGASFEVDAKEKFLWNCWPTDVDFSPDGAAYVLDWVSGWGQTPLGRIYRITPTDVAAEVTRRTGGDAAGDSASSRQRLPEAELIAEVKRLLAGGMTQRGEKELLELLGHADRRVRLEAQWELAGRGTNSITALVKVAKSDERQFARIHALWAIDQVMRAASFRPVVDNESMRPLDELLPLLDAEDLQVQLRAIATLGGLSFLNAQRPLKALLSNKNEPVRAAALTALLQIVHGNRRALVFVPTHKLWQLKAAGLLDKAVGADSQTSILRQWAESEFERPNWLEVLRPLLSTATDDFTLLALTRLLKNEATRLEGFHRSAYKELLSPWAKSDLAPARRAAALAARSSKDPEITNFLSDPDPRLIIAAGRAIHDVPIVEGFPALASFITKIDCPTNLYSRVIDACFRLGTQQHAQMLAGFAAREDVPDWARVLALRALGDWEKPSPLDRVNGLWRPLVSSVARSSRREEAQTSTPNTAPAPTQPSSQSLVTSAATNPLLARAAQAQTARNLGRAAELPVLPPDLGRSASFAEGMAVRRNLAPAQRAFLRVAGDLLNPFNLTEAGMPAGTREVLPLQIAVAETAAKLRVKEASSPLFEKFTRTNTAPELRRAILPALARLNAAQTPEAVKLALADADPQLRAAALPFLDRLEGEDSAALLASLISGPPSNAGPAANLPGGAVPLVPVFTNIPLAQAALAALAKLPGTKADEVLRDALARLEAKQLPLELALDVREAMRARNVPGARLSEPQASKTNSPADPQAAAAPAAQRAALPASLPAALRDTLFGGDAARGRDIFFNNQTVQCLRCHKIGNDGGTVGPNLSDVGRRYPREYLLESIVNPNARLAAGFETVVVTLKNGEAHAGLVKREAPNSLVLEITEPETGEAKTLTLRKSELERREAGLSAMPEGLAEQLSPFELRDVIEYLAGLK